MYPKLFDNPDKQLKYEKACEHAARHIERIRAGNHWDNGILTVPFLCCGCEEKRSDFFMMTGDQLPLCQKCFDSTVSQISNITNQTISMLEKIF